MALTEEEKAKIIEEEELRAEIRNKNEERPEKFVSRTENDDKAEFVLVAAGIIVVGYVIVEIISYFK